MAQSSMSLPLFMSLTLTVPNVPMTARMYTLACRTCRRSSTWVTSKWEHTIISVNIIHYEMPHSVSRNLKRNLRELFRNNRVIVLFVKDSSSTSALHFPFVLRLGPSCSFTTRAACEKSICRFLSFDLDYCPHCVSCVGLDCHGCALKLVALGPI